MENKDKNIKSIKDIIEKSDFWDRHSKRFITKEFQDYGYRLALKLNDLEHKSLYIKIAKNEDRRLVEEALRFAVDYPKAKNKGRIFMWKLKELKTPKKESNDQKS